MRRPCALCTVTCTGVHPSSEREPAAAQGLGMTISRHLFISLQDLTVQDTTQGLKSFEMFKKKKEMTTLIFPLLLLLGCCTDLFAFVRLIACSFTMA